MLYNLEDKKPKNSGENWVAPNAVVIGDVTLEKNTSIWFNATLRGDIENIVQDCKTLETIGVKSVAICSNDVKNYPEDSFENMIKFSKNHNFSFPYLFDESQKIAKNYDAVCTPDFFGYNKDLELQYRGRIRELKDLKPVQGGESDLLNAMKMIAKTDKGPKEQVPSMGCNIKWFNN